SASAPFHCALPAKRARERRSKSLKIEEPVPATGTRSSPLTLTPLELDIMKAVWRRFPATAKDVQDALRPRRPLAYTTVMTMMSRLHLKGFLRRALESRAYRYEPAVPFSDVRSA